eukprot:TRINITY_DN10734_c0_g1_i2.p1 TRINITY_DN10734_c0_g1~~TRINITY_DN10734_c0_g1_i2.p1  ORF type:complete len:219 (-),score=28.02 TRINITY_DN10734_c0_g1_i2:8-598(-)
MSSPHTKPRVYILLLNFEVFFQMISRLVTLQISNFQSQIFVLFMLSSLHVLNAAMRDLPTYLYHRLRYGRHSAVRSLKDTLLDRTKQTLDGHIFALSALVDYVVVFLACGWSLFVHWTTNTLDSTRWFQSIMVLLAQVTFKQFSEMFANFFRVGAYNVPVFWCWRHHHGSYLFFTMCAVLYFIIVFDEHINIMSFK